MEHVNPCIAEVVVVDDSAESLQLLTHILSKAGYSPRPIRDSRTALDIIKHNLPDLILLDICMPHIDGFELCRQLKQNEHTASIPVLFISACGETEDKVTGFDVGGSDFIAKPFQAVEILARVKSHIQLATLQKQRQKESESEIDSIIQTAMDGFWITSIEGNLLQVNDTYCSMSGYSREELLTMNIIDLEQTEQLDQVIAHIKKVIDLGEDRFETVHSRKNGSTYAVEISVQYRNGQFFCFLRDVTERNESNQQLNQTANLLSLFVQNSPIYAFIKEVTPAGSSVLHASDNFLEMIGFTREQMIGKITSELFPQEIATKIDADDLIVVQSGKMLQIDEDFNGRNYTTFKFPLVQGEKTLLAGYTIDITDRKLLEISREQIEHQRNISQKLESLGSLAGGMAHDFNNLMGGIFGYIELAKFASTEPQVKTDLVLALEGIERAKKLTQELLTFAKGGSPISRIGNLFPFVEESAKSALGSSNCSLYCAIEDNLCLCKFDPTQIAQVIENMVINAQQAMPNGGTITIHGKNIIIRNGDHPTIAHGKYVKISLKDHGVGIEKEQLLHIFDPFYSTKEMGRGLGLATSYSIIKRHGGSIKVESVLGEGTTFHIYIPTSENGCIVEPIHSDTHVTKKGTIIVMDDEPMMRFTITRMLQYIGFASIATCDGKEAIASFTTERSAGRPVAALILDLTVPNGMGGVETVNEIRKIDQTTPIFVVSGYADDPVMENPVAYGFSGSIAKPFGKNELVRVLGE